MLKTIIKTSLVIMLSGLFMPAQVSAHNGIGANSLDIIRDMGLSLDKLTEPLAFAVKRGVPYDEAKDPALRRGSENSEQPQNDFFIIPIALFVGMGLFLYYNKL